MGKKTLGLNSSAQDVFNVPGIFKMKRRLMHRQRGKGLLKRRFRLRLIRLRRKLQKLNGLYRLKLVVNLLLKRRFRKAEERAAKQAARQALLAEKKAQLEARRAAKQVPKARSIPTTAARAPKKHTVVEIQGSPKRVVIVGSGRKTRARAVVPPSRYE